jgi:hypothetical protein
MPVAKQGLYKHSRQWFNSRHVMAAIDIHAAIEDQLQVVLSVVRAEAIWRGSATVGHLWSSCCWAPSQTRGRVCNLVVKFTVTLRLRRTHDHILLSYLRLWGPFLSPHTARRAAVKYSNRPSSYGVPRRKARCWKTLPSSAVNTLTDKTSLWMIVNSKDWLRALR